jgi:hypothetical protein
MGLSPHTVESASSCAVQALLRSCDDMLETGGYSGMCKGYVLSWGMKITWHQEGAFQGWRH